MIHRLLVPLACLLALSSCTIVESHVARFHALPAKGSGQTFKVQAQAGQSHLEFASYAQQVSQHLQVYGWRPTSSGAAADYKVVISYHLGDSHEILRSMPLIGQTGGGTTFHTGGFTGAGGGGSFYGTSTSPATFGAVGSMPYSITGYDRYLKITIQDRNGAEVFLGRVNSLGTRHDLAGVLPEMIDSLFRGFPGKSGDTRRVRIVDESRDLN